MARINNLTNFLTDVAAAIKTKKGDSASIAAEDFDTEILALPGGQGNYEQKTVPISQNGEITITPDTGYDAMDEVTVQVAVPEKQLQTKNYNFTQNTTTTLTPETGYDGFSSIGLNINVSGGGASNIYKFATLAEAQAKNDYNVGDIACVMNEKRIPFYPYLRWSKRTDKLVLSGETGIRLFPVDTITFTQTPTMDVTTTWTVKVNNKTKTYTMKIIITNSTVDIQLPITGSANSVIEFHFVWSSVDGLTYTFNYGGYNTNMTLAEIRDIRLQRRKLS